MSDNQLSKMSDNAVYVRINHRVLEDDGDNYIWFYRRDNRWLVEFGYAHNTRIMRKWYDDIQNLLKDYPYEP